MIRIVHSVHPDVGCGGQHTTSGNGHRAIQTATQDNVIVGSTAQKVIAIAAFERVVALATDKGVIALTAVEMVILVRADQQVVARAADENMSRIRRRRSVDGVVARAAGHVLDIRGQGVPFTAFTIVLGAGA